MTKTLLIPGFGTKIKYSTDSIFGFGSFKNEIQSGSVRIFDWGINDNFNRLNLFKYIGLYRAEKKLADDTKTITKLDNLIKDTKPSTIVCHSMGCHIMTKYLQTYQIPDFVTKIVYLSADCDRGEIDEIKTNHPIIYNYFCPWDNALLSSIIVNHKHFPIGLYPVKSSKVKNHFWPLWIPINLHDSYKKDKFLKVKIESKLLSLV